jgi:C1A family cysteine protease
MFGWKPDRPDRRDKLFGVHIKPTLTETPPKVDLRQWTSPVEDQSSVGSCTANATVGAIEYNDIKRNPGHMDLSRLFLYYNTRVIERSVNVDAGAYIRDVIKTAAKDGVCEERLWPYRVSRWYVKPNRACYKNAIKYKIKMYARVTTFDGIIQALADGYPVIFGATLYESFQSPPVSEEGVVPMPKPNERTIGGHAMLIVGYDKDQKHFIIRNSWGTGWGQDGHCVMPFDYFKTIGDLVDDLWIIKL